MAQSQSPDSQQSQDQDQEKDASPAVHVRNLSYLFPDGASGLQDISLDLPRGSRTLLIGANGAGKTTLLRLLSGRRLPPPSSTVRILSTDPFQHTLSSDVTYLGLEWVLNPVVRSDVDVPTLLASVGGDAYPARRDELVRVLDVDLRWRMHAVSDGERRRVQLAMGLLRPWRVLLLDEVTVDLDLLSRRRFLDWLRAETERTDSGQGQGRNGGGTVVYATHVLDGLDSWPTHLVHMSQGRVKEWGLAEELRAGAGLRGSKGTVLGLGDLALGWLKDDYEERGPRNAGRNGGGESESKSYASVRDEIGGYGLEKRPPPPRDA